MEFWALSLPEASFMYLGLAIQALVRSSLVRLLPRLVTIWMFVLLWRELRAGGNWRMLIGYPFTCLILLILFWPEATVFSRRITRTVDASQVASYAASQDPDAEVVTAEDTGLVPMQLQQPTRVAPGMRLILKAITDFHLAVARRISDRAHRPFASLAPMQWLIGMELTTEITTAVADWVHSCYLPVLTSTLTGQQGRTIEELRPWGNTPIRDALRSRTVTPGANTGITWMRQGSTSDPSVTCEVYLEAVLLRTQGWLFELKSPKGTPLSEVFQQEFGMDSIVQAQFLIEREMRKAAGPAVPAPSLAGYYGALRGSSVLTNILQGAGTGAAGGWLGTLIGAATGGVRGLGAETQQVLDALSWVIRLALMATWYGPYLLGMISLVMQSLFPFVLLWAMIPRYQLQPLLYFFTALIFVHSTPLWYALVDQIARLAAAQVPQVGTGYDAAIVQWVGSGLWVATITAFGLIVVPAVIVMVLFVKTLPAIGGLIHGRM